MGSHDSNADRRGRRTIDEFGELCGAADPGSDALASRIKQMDRSTLEAVTECAVRCFCGVAAREWRLLEALEQWPEVLEEVEEELEHQYAD